MEEAPSSWTVCSSLKATRFKVPDLDPDPPVDTMDGCLAGVVCWELLVDEQDFFTLLCWWWGSPWNNFSYSNVSESIWSYLNVSFCIWRYLEVSGGIWRQSKVSGGIWRYLNVSEVFTRLTTKLSKKSNESLRNWGPAFSDRLKLIGPWKSSSQRQVEKDQL